MKVYKNRYGGEHYDVEIADMVGCVFNYVAKEEINSDDRIVFRSEDEEFILYHDQSCCESVYIESITGDLNDLVGARINIATEESFENTGSMEHGTFTFYKFATRKGYVDIRWVGESNGYYSESVDLDYKKLSDRSMEEIIAAKRVIEPTPEYKQRKVRVRR